MRDSGIRLLVVHAEYTDRLSYYDDWLDAFLSAPQFDVTIFNPFIEGRGPELHKLLREVDAVVLLHSTNGDTTIYMDRYADIFADRKIPLLSFVGNELNLPGSPIAAKRALLKKIKPDWIATQLLEEAGDYLFGDIPSNGIVSIPHALNPSMFQCRIPLDDRKIDIGTRSARYVAHLGDDDRARLIEFFDKMGKEQRAVIDISDARYDRAGWALFLNRCKGTVATEAGSWYLERDDTTVNAVRSYIIGQSSGIVIPNDSRLRSLGHKLPWWVRASLRKILHNWPVRHEAALNEKFSHSEIYRRFFADKGKPDVYGKCISSRHFDAIGTKTCQIMFRGRFNDILIADRHYLALDEDFSNIDVVMTRFFDLDERRRMVEEAFNFVMDGHTYMHRMNKIYMILSDD